MGAGFGRHEGCAGAGRDAGTLRADPLDRRGPAVAGRLPGGDGLFGVAERHDLLEWRRRARRRQLRAAAGPLRAAAQRLPGPAAVDVPQPDRRRARPARRRYAGRGCVFRLRRHEPAHDQRLPRLLDPQRQLRPADRRVCVASRLDVFRTGGRSDDGERGARDLDRRRRVAGAGGNDRSERAERYSHRCRHRGARRDDRYHGRRSLHRQGRGCANGFGGAVRHGTELVESRLPRHRRDRGQRQHRRYRQQRHARGRRPADGRRGHRCRLGPD